MPIVYFEFRYRHQKMYKEDLEVEFVDEIFQFKKYFSNLSIKKKYVRKVKKSPGYSFGAVSVPPPSRSYRRPSLGPVAVLKFSVPEMEVTV